MNDRSFIERCPACNSTELERHVIVHHMICAYVGPEYDFGRNSERKHCPKCMRGLVARGEDWEVVGTSVLCGQCGSERILPP
ncbi:hypothetical protein [Phyllobacterium sophorae]|jgi:uncharacterized protein (DUF983 family)|uniref:TackOD1 domain-containing metal-binding protein n=1 Tax=Phyllobacterium sophorae TaxID=1520277 RepID=UPI0026C47EC4